MARWRERSRELYELKMKREAEVREAIKENARRVEEAESDYQDALRRFEDEVGGKEAADELLSGKAEWRENRWAWVEYVAMINGAAITEEQLARLKRKVSGLGFRV
jgi:hypothetical protein